MSLQTFLNEVNKNHMAVNYVQIRKNGVITEDYSRLESKTRLNTWSACKSIVSVAVGIAMDEGLITLDERLVDSFQECLPENIDKSLQELTVRDMLTMTTGLENALFFGDDPIRYRTKDWISYFFNQSFPHENGKKFLYCNFNTYMLACLVEKKAGQPFVDYLQPRLFGPLEIFSPDWTKCPMGHAHAANGLYVTIDELANFGQMLLQNGNFGGKQIVSKAFLEEATKNQMPETETAVRYGYQFWISENNDYYYASGKFGQYCIVVPEKQAVVAIMSLESKDLMPLIREHILAEI